MVDGPGAGDVLRRTRLPPVGGGLPTFGHPPLALIGPRPRGTLVDRVAVLREMVREAERVIDHQARVWEGLDGKAEQLMRLALLALAGAVGLATFLLQMRDVHLDEVFLALFLAAGFVVVLATLFFVSAYAGIRSDRRFDVGPAPAWLAERSHRRNPALGAHLREVLATYDEDYEANRRRMDLVARSRKRGVLMLVAGIAVYAVGFIYVVGRTML